MPIVTKNQLAAKNKSGNGLRDNDIGSNRQNHAAVKKLADLFIKAAKVIGEDNEALELTFDAWGKALHTLADTPVTQRTQGTVVRALRDLEGLEDHLTHRDGITNLTGYEAIVKALPAVGSNKQELDSLLRTANGVLELGLEKSVLKPVDPREQERLRQAEERQRQAEERQRQEMERQRQAEERDRQERERQRQERERQLREQERQRQERERQLREQERQRQEREQQRRAEERQRQAREQQRREQKVRELKQERDAFLQEDYTGTDYESRDVDALKLDPEYQQKLNTLDRVQEVEENDNLLEDQKKEFLKNAGKILGDPLSRRKQEKEDAALLNEDERKNEKPLTQTKAVMVSQDLKDSFLKRFPDSGKLQARDRFGNTFQGTASILEALSREDIRLYIDVPEDPEGRCTCLKGEGGKLLISAGPVHHGDPGVKLDYADPDPTLESEFTRYFEENGIESAVGPDGTVYTKKEDMVRALDDDKRLMLLGKDREFAVAVCRQDGSLFATGKSYRAEMGFESVSPDRLPEKTTLFGIKDDDILFAVTDGGERLTSPEAIRREVRTGDGELRIHTRQDPEAAYALRYREGHAAISKYAVPESQIEKLQDADYESCLPEEIEEKRILNWKESEIDHAEDEKGRRYNTPEEIKIALYGADKTLHLYTKGKEGEAGEHELPYVVEKRNNRFYVSPERVPKFGDQMAVLGGQLSEMDETDFQRAYRPMDAREFLDKNFTLSTEHRVSFALDENGNRFTGAEEVAKELDRSEDRTLYVFDDTGELPYAVRKTDGKFYRSSERIGTRNVMPETDSFQPKKTLHVDELGERKDATEYFHLKTLKDEAGKDQEYHQNEITRITTIRKNGMPKPPERPVRPRLGVWNTFVRGLKKVFTLGFGGETDAYKAYTDRKRKYAEDLEAYPAREKEHEAKKKAYEDVQKNGDELLEFHNKGLVNANKRLDDIRERMAVETADLDADTLEHRKRDAVTYRNRIEARLEGVQDLEKTGKITPENIFAHVWLKEAECSGKPASDPEARKALCAYIAADAVQNDILNSRFKGTDKTAQTSDALDERKIAPLNSGKAVDALMKDEELKKLLDKQGDAPIRPEEIKNRFQFLAAARKEAENKDTAVYAKAMADLEKTFGKQELSEEALEEVLRYRKIRDARDSYVMKYDNPRKGLGIIFAGKPTDAEKEPFRDAYRALKAQNKGPMGLGEMEKALNAKRVELQEQAEMSQPQSYS